MNYPRKCVPTTIFDCSPSHAILVPGLLAKMLDAGSVIR